VDGALRREHEIEALPAVEHGKRLVAHFEIAVRVLRMRGQERAAHRIDHAFELRLGHRDVAGIGQLVGDDLHVGDRAGAEGHAQLLGALAALGKAERVHRGLGPCARHAAGARSGAVPLIEDALENGEAGLAAHLVVVAAEHSGEVEIAEIEAGEIDAINGGDTARRGEGVFGKSGAGWEMTPEPQSQGGDSQKANAMSGLLHGLPPLAETASAARLFQRISGYSPHSSILTLGEVCGGALTGPGASFYMLPTGGTVWRILVSTRPGFPFSTKQEGSGPWPVVASCPAKPCSPATM